MDTILIADDNPQNLKVLSGLLKQQGYKIRAATNGKQALNSFQAEPPDLVLMDIQMPKMDGYDVCRSIKKQDCHRLIPVIFISAMEEAFNKTMAFEAGGSDYITKPFQAEEVLARIETHLKLYKSQKQLTNKNIEYERQLVQMQKMEAIGTLAGGIAHDFNNILSAIIGFTEIALMHTPKGTMIEENLMEVYSAGKRATELVKQILAVARRSDERTNPIQPKVITKEVLKFLRSTTPATIEIVQRLESSAFIMGNATQVHQLLMNLCTNAIQAMENLCGVLTVSIEDVLLDKKDLLIGMKPGAYVAIKVSDTGVGIAPELIEQVFNPYFTTKGPGEGTGLGLATVHGIIKSYEGKIDVESQPGKGATFTVYLPVSKKQEKQQADKSGALPLGKENILLVDDEVAIVKMESKMLERLGYSVTVSSNGLEALELFKNRADDFDLILTDMTMPDITGDKLAVELMQIRPDIPIVLCTGYSKQMSNEAALKMGIRAFINKPFTMGDLAETIRNALD